MSLYTLTVDLLAKTGSFERDMGKAARISERDARRIEVAATKMGLALGTALAGAATGMTVMVKRTMDTMAETSKMAGQIGVATEQLTALRYAAQQMAGVSDGQFDMALRRMTRRISEAAAGGGPAAKAIEAMGLSAKELARLSPDEQFRRIADGIKATSDQGARLRHVMALMDTEGMPLVNMLQQGAAAMGDWELAARRMGLTFSSQTAKQAEAFGQQMDRVTASMTGFGRQVTAELLPTMNELADRFVGIHNDGELAKSVAEGIGTSFRAAAAGIKVMSEVLPPAIAGLTALTTVKVSQAMYARLQATMANIKADQAATMQAIASARATEAKAAAHVVEAGMSLRAASTNRQRLLAERALTAAVNDHTLARQRLATAEAAAAAASAGLAARAGRSALALLGGKAGLLITVAATAAAWLHFRDNTNAAREALESLSGPLEDRIQQLREMDSLTRAGLLAELESSVRDSGREVEAEVERMIRRVEGLLAIGFTKTGEAYNLFPEEVREAARTYANNVRDVTAAYKEGEISAREYNEQLDAERRLLMQTDGAARALGDGVALQGSAVAKATTEHERLSKELDAAAGVQRDAEAATDGMTDALRRQQEQAAATGTAVGGFAAKLREEILKGEEELARIRGGAAGQLDHQFRAAIAEQGVVDPFQLLDVMEAYQKRRAQLLQIDKAQEAARGTSSKGTDRQAESLARYNLEAERAAATLAGPLRQAEVEHDQRLRHLREELAAGNIEQDAFNKLKDEATAQLERNTRALEAQMRAPDELLGAMREELEMLGMVGEQRELYRRGLQAERDMRDAINRANEAGAGINDDVAESLIRQARAWGVASVEIEEAARAAEDWRWTVGSSVENVADLFSNLFTGQIKGTRDFFTELKDIWKRGWWDIIRMSLQQSFVNPIQKAIQGMITGQGFAGAGQGPASLAQGIAAYLPMGGGATAIGTGTVAANGLFPGWGFVGPGMAGMVGPGGMGAGGFGMPGMMPSKNLLTGKFAGGMPYASAALGVLGAYYGLTQRGNNGLTSGLAGLSYGALGIGVGGAIAGGLGAIGTGAGLAGVGAGAMGGATSAMGTAAGAIGSASWIPVVGWTLAALGAIDAISGGRLFGTKYRPESQTQTLGIDASGGMVSASVHETRKRSLFRGTARRDRAIEATAEQRRAAQDLYEAMESVARSASRQLGLATVDIVAGSIEQVYNREGELQSEMSRVLGQTYAETFDEFTSRLASEQLIAAVAQIDSAASRIAQDWRSSAEVLAEGAEFFMTAANDARNGMDLWTGIGLQALTGFVEQMQMGEETLGQAYSRLAGIAGDYSTLITDIDTQLIGEGLNSYQAQALQVERTYRQQVKAANDYAKALGLTGARSEDLAKIEQLRAVNLGKLQAQMEADNAAFLGQLALSDLSTLRDDQKLAEAMRQLDDAAAAGDTQAAQQAAQAALGFGRSLYASGRDYQSLYDQVTGRLSGMTLDPDDLDMGDLADELEAMHEGLARAIFELAAQGEHVITAPIRAEQQRTNELLGHVLEELRRQGSSAAAGRLREELNSRSPVLVR